eukprot:GHRQ01010668.1.p2 GENE.GHRQ01010668.1~~GHRQ01010668.1.p2  ORF type:complete len:101 (-),score=13.70 GHRQ01010668.1:388-660(-)
MQLGGSSSPCCSPNSFATAAQNTFGLAQDTSCSSGQSWLGSAVRSASQRRSPWNCFIKRATFVCCTVCWSGTQTGAGPRSDACHEAYTAA